jgi:patatin-like phospholipase/acyl hydrolase
MGPSPKTSFSDRVEKKDLPKQLLSLDGGGVKGISSLLILEAIMEEVKKREINDGTNTSTAPRKPVDYFHLAAGTSTGGLIALMLFRLHMSVPEVKTQYNTLAKDVFSPRFFGYSLHNMGTIGYWLGNGYLKTKAVFSRSQFSDGPLKEAINKVVKDHGIDVDDKKAEGGAILRHKDAGKM